MIMIRVFTAFSGYDSQCLALNYLRENDIIRDYYPNGDSWSPRFKKYQIENSAEYFVAIIANNIKDLDFSKLEE